MAAPSVTDRIYLRDAQCRAFDAAVVAVEDGGRVALDATAFYATGGGQPHDMGTLAWDGGSAAVTGGNMEPLRARMDFEFGLLPEGFGAQVAELVNAEIAADRPVEVSFWPGAEALAAADLIRTKVNLIPESVTEIRVVDIVGLDRQADGGTHVASTGEVGRFEVTKTESKGKANKRLRIALGDA